MVEIWTPSGYVDSMDQWKQRSRNSTKDQPLYPAYVPTIDSTPYGTLLRKYGFIFGSNEKVTDDNCGMIYRKIQCSSNALHKPSWRHNRCNDPGCPVCHVKFAARSADRVTERVQGYKTVYRNSKTYHLIFWPKPRAGRPYASLRAAFNDAKKMMREMGVTSATVWHHPYRIKERVKELLRRYRSSKGLDGKAGFWKLAHDDVLDLGGIEQYMEYGPHFHAIATGFLENVKTYSERTGAGYKKKRYLEKEENVHEVAHYISTHAAREAGKPSVRYFGEISYRKLARECVDERIKDVLCETCGSRLEEHDCDEAGNLYLNGDGRSLKKLKDNITEKVKYYLYWKYGQPKPDMATHAQSMITRYCNR
jgi:hypothetical protein